MGDWRGALEGLVLSEPRSERRRTANPQLCRICGTHLSRTFVNLGLSPFSNSNVLPERAHEGEKFFPLHAFVCEICYLVQLEEFQTPEEIFSDYLYFSSFSTSWLRHAETYANEMYERFSLGDGSKVVEVASNDGYLLQYFKARGVPVLGVEPAANVAEVARKKGIPSEVAFFGETTAERMRQAGHAADLMAANNVLAHVPDILDFMSGFRVLLKSEGVVTFEFPHLLRQIENSQFDQVYHEHFSYLSLIVVQDVARRVGLRVFDVEELSTHGGSLRVFATPRASSHPETGNVAGVLASEVNAGLDRIEGYLGFAKTTLSIKLDSLEFLIEAKRAGKRICAYGAAAKGNTFLNYLGVGTEIIDAVADRSPYKQGTLLPGSRIPVISPERLDELKPDYVIILPWNLKAEIAVQLAHIREWGGRLVVAIPKMAVL